MADLVARSPFAPFRDALAAQPCLGQPALRAAITAAYRRAEPDCVAALLDRASLPPAAASRARRLAEHLIRRLRAKAGAGPIESLMREYALSSPEGVALMCLAEALLRIPDNETRDALIRDKIAAGDWRAHLGRGGSLFVNAATWGLVITGQLNATSSEGGLSAALTRLIARGGEPIIRRAVDLAMRLLGHHFVAGETIQQALAHARPLEARGFRYSYDMLGEAAMTAADAARYLAAYQQAIAAIGQAASGRGVIAGPGISVKLSALHPRYERSQRPRVMRELLPRLQDLALRAKAQDIGLNIDAEEAARLDLSLDLLEALALDPALDGWNGLGFVVQAYGKRAPFVIDWLTDLGRRSGHRLMVRLVKGAYWDSEIKRAQVDGLADFPVFTRKVHTDVSYLACARALLDAPDAAFPQFATHNAQTLAAVMQMAGPDYRPEQYEFQCLHGMGEPLYEEVVGPLGRPCRIYAPVGTHETLLAYLVRRLLENGANTSFVHRIADAAVPVEALAADPVAAARAIEPLGAPHRAIALPRDILGPDVANSAALDLTNEAELAGLAGALEASAAWGWTAGTGAGARAVRNPADRDDVVGWCADASADEIAAAVASAQGAGAAWAGSPVSHRADCLRRTADALETRMPLLLGLIVREAGKTLPNAIAEVREAVDFLRYYASEAETLSASPLGPVACISPWNFPLAIFTGQVAAALAAGNTVLAKPAEETPLIAAECVRLMHEAGVPPEVLHLLPGDGEVGAALVADPRVQGVIFTGSTEVARLINRQLAGRLTLGGKPVPLIAETGGLNAMIVDSSALAEQVVASVLASAFDSAGQRCSALRMLCVQADVAEPILAMLRGAMRELRVGNPADLATDVGPVITAAARDAILDHVRLMQGRGFRVESVKLPQETGPGTFVAPTLIEIGQAADLRREVFGPVLHVLRYERDRLDVLIREINASGYALTCGLQTRIDETVARVTKHAAAGNVYINRDIIGAKVGVQPFGGSGLSGTGPKAGGPLYLRRLVADAVPFQFSGSAPERNDRRQDCRRSDSRDQTAPARDDRRQDCQRSEPRDQLAPARAFAAWLASAGHAEAAARCERFLLTSPLGWTVTLPGPVGESNIYTLRPRGAVAALARSPEGLMTQLAAILATGNQAVIEVDNPVRAGLEGIPADVAAQIRIVESADAVADLKMVLFEGDAAALTALNRRLAERDGPIVQVQAVAPGQADYDLSRLLEERSVTTNTAAAGGNASLMMIG